MRLAILLLLGGCISKSALWDKDGDGYLSVEVEGGTDCDDADATVHPGAIEACGNGKDDDCDGETDDAGEGESTWYADADGDGDGDPDGATVAACSAPSGYGPAVDCDDGDARISTSAEEACNGYDDDCDGDTDESGELVTWYADADGDGHGVEADSVEACSPPDGYAAEAGDCDDGDASVHPDAEETWYDGVDSDCDGADDFDQDGDGYAATASSGDDCDDTDAGVNPGAEEVCGDHVDQDCDDGHNGCDATGTHYLATVRQAAFEGPTAGFGHLVAAGDLDGDGAYDAVISGYGSDLYVFQSPVSGTISTTRADADVDFLSTTNGPEGLGADCDLNGDGRHDIVAGVSEEYVVYGFYGSLSGSLSTSSADLKIGPADTIWDLFGNRVACGGDLDADGNDDVVVGAPFLHPDLGQTYTYVYNGPLAGTTERDAYDARITDFDDMESATLGYSLSISGDATGDGRADLLVGTMEEGWIHLLEGPVTGELVSSEFLASFRPSDVSSQPGYAVDLVPDVDGDGRDDVFSGAPGYASKTGAAYLYLSPFSGEISASAATRFTGARSGDVFGIAIAAGDLNGDGSTDLAVGASGNDDGGTSGGAVHVFYGPFSATTYTASTADLTLLGTTSEQAGRSLAIADFDADGYGDLLIGGYGVAWLVHGSGR